MEDMELKAIWKAYDNKIDKLIQLNLNTFAQLQVLKAQSQVKSFLPKVFGIIVGALWVLFLGTFALFALKKVELFFAVSVGAIMVITIMAIFSYIKDIVLIKQVNNDESITSVQQKLAQLQSSSIRTVRISVLQLPFYTTFYLSVQMLVTGNLFTLFLIGAITGLATYGAIWLYRNINYKNINKKWLRLLLRDSGWESATRAMEFLYEIDTFKTQE